MKRYEEGDIMTCYFVIHEHDGCKTIRAWSDRKDYVKIYMDFHKCKNYRMKKITDTSIAIMKIIEENLYDEIDMYNIQTKDDKGRIKTIVAPLTRTEQTLIASEASELLSSRINYGYINECMYYLKGKYLKGLKDIFLKDAIDSVVYGNTSKIINELGIDELNVLLYSIPDQFGV